MIGIAGKYGNHSSVQWHRSVARHIIYQNIGIKRAQGCSGDLGQEQVLCVGGQREEPSQENSEQLCEVQERTEKT